jgi:toxin FitB
MARGRPLKFLLDTNVISEIRKLERTEPNVAKWVAQTPVKEIGTSVLVLAEIRRGIELKRRRDAEQAAALDRWFAQMRSRLGDRVLPIDEPIAEAWALLSVPDPLPLIDGLLAATAKVHGLMLVKRNTADVARTGVAILDPLQI